MEGQQQQHCSPSKKNMQPLQMCNRKKNMVVRLLGCAVDLIRQTPYHDPPEDSWQAQRISQMLRPTEKALPLPKTSCLAKPVKFIVRRQVVMLDRSAEDFNKRMYRMISCMIVTCSLRKCSLCETCPPGNVIQHVAESLLKLLRWC